MRGSRGFTLLETLATLTVAAVVGAFATTTLIDLVRTAQLAGAVRTTASGLRLARGRALSGAGPIEVRFEEAPGRSAVYDEGGRLLNVHTLPPGVSFAGLPVRRRVRFGPLGSGENATVRLGAAHRERRIVVNQRGRVRIQ